MNPAVKKSLFWAAAGAGTLLAARAFVRNRRLISLEGKVALITGGSRGLGLVIAREMASQGARLAICARDADEVGRGRDDLVQKHGAEVLAIPCDVTDPDQVRSLVRRTIDAYGRLDVLVNNAGVIMSGPVDHMTTGDFDESLKTHFWGPYHAVEAALPALRKARGRIVNIASLGGKVSVPHLLPYGVGKFALVGYSEGLRAELAKDGVLVTTVTPGLMRTGSVRNAFFKGKHRQEYAAAALMASTPILSVAAETAARKIVDACRHGDADLTLTLPGKFLALLHGVNPGVTADLFGLIDRVMPGMGGIGDQRARGYQSESALAPSLATVLQDRAAARNNEL